MSAIRTQLHASVDPRSGVRQPRRPEVRESLQAVVTNGQDLAAQVNRWHLAARAHLAQAHRADHRINQLQEGLVTIEKSLGRVCPVMVGVSAPLSAFAQAMHADVLAHGALGLLAAGLASGAVWAASVLGLKRRIGELTRHCAQEQDRAQDYSRLAEALDPGRRASVRVPTLGGLTPPRRHGRT